ncbi:thiolase C-terminal domain-containing protein [Bradyrhizobium sp. AZCC 2289]|uniref:thiolase C-terminal domain-containing protein n=1 Tax=Bradyrhizobium sp. AZCC 2289 TaxID=3117026 RepID=UPI002FF1A62A
MNSIKDQAAIVGIGRTEFSSRSGRSELRLALEAITEALDDAGLEPDQVDGLVRYGIAQTGASEALVAHNLGLPLVRFWACVDLGGAASCALLGQASLAVASGRANYVVIYRTLNGRSGIRPGSGDTAKLYRNQDPGYDNFLVPHGFTAPSQVFAMMARRRMHEYGMTNEQLGKVAVTARAYANRNPRAQLYNKTLTLEDYFASPVISSPLRKFDMCLQTDGAVALVVTTPERAADLKGKPVYVKAAAQAAMPEIQGPLHSFIGRKDILESSGRLAAAEVYREAGVGPKDIDVAQLYDCFTPTLMQQLEDYGFCGKGEAGGFVDDGHISPNGSIPVNTAGGNLAEGYIHGVNHLLEGVRQLRGTSTSQVANAETCLVTAGLPYPTSAAILGSVRG